MPTSEAGGHRPPHPHPTPLPPRERGKGEGGAVLLVAIVTLVVLSVLGAAFASFMAERARTAGQAVQAAKALAITEAGLDYGVGWVIRNTDQIRNVGDNYTQIVTFGGGTFLASVTRTSSLGEFEIVSAGCVGSRSSECGGGATTQALAERKVQARLFPGEVIKDGNFAVTDLATYWPPYASPPPGYNVCPTASPGCLWSSASATPDGSGSLLASTAVGSNKTLKGAREQNFSGFLSARIPVQWSWKVKFGVTGDVPDKAKVEYRVAFDDGTTKRLGPPVDGTGYGPPGSGWILNSGSLTLGGQLASSVLLTVDLKTAPLASALVSVFIDEVSLKVPRVVADWQER